MTIPELRRVKVSTEHELRNWLNKYSDLEQVVMIVTCNKKSRHKHITGDQVRDTVVQSGWTVGRRYTLDGNLVGNVVRPT